MRTKTFHVLAAAVLLLSGAASGCAGAGDTLGSGGQTGAGGASATGGQTGAGGASTGGGGASGIGGSAGAGGDFQAVLAIFAARCVNCHDSTKSGLPTYPQLSLTATDAYAALVSHPADETCGGARVVPGSSASSYLFHKISDATPCYGMRMPRPFEVLPVAPLSAADIATIEQWIDAGAPR